MKKVILTALLAIVSVSNSAHALASKQTISSAMLGGLASTSYSTVPLNWSVTNVKTSFTSNLTWTNGGTSYSEPVVYTLNYIKGLCTYTNSAGTAGSDGVDLSLASTAMGSSTKFVPSTSSSFTSTTYTINKVEVLVKYTFTYPSSYPSLGGTEGNKTVYSTLSGLSMPITVSYGGLSKTMLFVKLSSSNPF